jgi:hypothetical protein
MHSPYRDLPSLQRMITYHKQASRIYGNLDPYEKLVLKRSINSAIFTLDMLDDISFEELELTIYMKVSDPDMAKFTKLYEYQLEEAKLHPDNFVHNLHGFFKKTGYLILENPRNFFDFIDFVSRKHRENNDYSKIFDAYISLLLQQATYLGFLKGYKEKLCCGLSTNNELLFKDDVYPYSDMANYEMENELYDALMKNKNIDPKHITEAYRKYGYEVNDITDVEEIDSTSRMYDNNHHMMLSYITEDTLDILPNTVYKPHELNLPRIWVESSLLLEKLQKRKYCLPSDGVIANITMLGK